jgi:uracil phosphoribosyltransferase
MCATGGSASVCIKNLIDKGVSIDKIVFINLISSENGLDRLLTDHPGLKIVTAVID